ncbi:hypothetical protein IW262DRAFT_1540850 [Armillaria fumosa]|nr:hypothetical protein IW262DRAFT_1540850 [Armillaria fumosa]
MTPNPKLMFWTAIDWVRSFTAVYSKASKTFKQTLNLTCAARLVFELFAARPCLKLKDLKCPTLVIMAEEDDIIPPDITRNIVRQALGKVELVPAPGGYFDVMEGRKGYETNINAQTAFLKKLME